MMIPLRDLLQHAIKRAHASTQVSATQMVSAAEDCLAQLMGSRKRDVRVVSFHDGTMIIETLHSSASHFLQSHEPHLIKTLQQRHPEYPIRLFRYRVVHHFRKRDL